MLSNRKLSNISNSDSNKQESSFYLLKRLYKEHVSGEKKTFLIAMLCMLVIAITTGVQVKLLEPAINEIFVNQDRIMLYVIPLMVVANSLIKGVATFFEGTLMRQVGQKIVNDIQLRLYAHLIKADMKFLNEYPSGNLISRFTNDINAMRKSVSDIFTGVAKELITIIILLCVMMLNSIHLTVVVIVLFPLSFYPIIRLGKRMRKIARSMQEQQGGFTVQLDETFKNNRIIKSYCRENYEISRARKIINKFLETYRKAANIEAASSPIMETIGGVAIAFIIFYGGFQVFNGNTTPGSFVSFVVSILALYRPLKAVSNLNTALQQGLAASKRLFSMIDEAPEIVDNPKQPYVKFDKFDIEFKDVVFSYKGEKNILNGLNMKIPHGKTVALVGGSGSGKTTVLNLLQRMYDADSGTILLNNLNTKDVRLKSLRDSFALVSQEVALFDDTVKENIRYGRLDATDEEIVNAAMVAAAHEFICAFPKGYEANIGQHGLKISGGQRQRIAIARAILKNAPVLLLDEATSALDSISEQKVKMALDYLKQGRTTIVVAHRLSTIENADYICVMNEGRVIECGTHEELIKKGGEYAALHNQLEFESSK